MNGTLPWPEQRPCDPVLWHWPYSLRMTLEMFRLILPRDASVYLELGSFVGSSAQLAAQLAPQARIVCVDTWDGRAGPYDVDRQHSLVELFQANLWPWKPRVDMIEATTIAGLQLVADQGIKPTLVFIDADHSYPAVDADISLTQALFPDAIICGDDFGEPDVQQAVHEHFHSYIGVCGATSWWAIPKDPRHLHYRNINDSGSAP